MNDELNALLQAIRDRAFYPAFAYGITLLIALWRRWQPAVFERIPKPIQWLPAVVLAGATAFVASFQSGLSADLAIAVTLYTMAMGGPLAVGVHRIVKESIDPRPPTRTPAALALLVIVGAFSITACAAVKPAARTVNDLARESCALYFAERSGISLEDALRGICRTRRILDPFIRELTQAQQRAGIQASLTELRSQ